MRHRLPIIIGIAMVVAFAAISGSLGVGASVATHEAVPERRISLANLIKGITARKGLPPDEVQLRVPDEMMIAESMRNDGDSVASVAGVINNDCKKSVMQSSVPSDILTNGPILAAG